MTKDETIKLAMEIRESLSELGIQQTISIGQPTLVQEPTTRQKAAEAALKALRGLPASAWMPDTAESLYEAVKALEAFLAASKGERTDKDRALALALEALELLIDTEHTLGALDYGDNAITAIKQALAAPVEEPVARSNWWYEN